MKKRKKNPSRNRAENRGRVGGRTREEESRGVEERRLEIRRGDQYACTGNAFGRWRSCPHASGTHHRKEKKKNLLSLLSLTNLILFQSIHQLVITPAFKRHSSLSFYPLCVRNTFRNNKKTQHAVRLYEKKKKKYCVCARLSLSFFFHCEKWRFVNHLTR